MRDRQTGVTRIADVRPDGEHGNRGTSSARPAISGDGVLVAFLSLSSNLAGRDSETTDVFLTTSPFLAPPTTGALATQDAVAPSTEALAHADCVGVCGAERVVGAADLITGVNIALGGLPLDVCSSFDADGDGMVTVGELIGGVHNALNGCQARRSRVGVPEPQPARAPAPWRQPAAQLVHHSDRGSQYASEPYRAALREHGIVCSMSRRGNCWDNAVVESFFATVKTELIHRRSWPTRREVITAITEYIEVFYNRHRFHSFLAYRSPADYEEETRRTAAPAA